MHWSNQSNQLKIKIDIIGSEDFLLLILGIFIAPFRYVLLMSLVFKIIAKKKGISPMELKRRIVKGWTSKNRKTSSVSDLRKVSLFKIATSHLPALLCVMVLLPAPRSATAGFEIIEVKKELPTKQKTNQFVPFSHTKSGVGNDVRLEDVIDVLVERPWKYEFVSKEIQALKVSWLSRGSAISEIIAQLGRNYGIETYYVESAGEVHVDWASGFCSKRIDEEKERRDEFNKEIMFGMKDTSFPSVFKVVRDERVYLC